MTELTTAYKIKANAFEFTFNHQELAETNLLQIAPTHYHVIQQCQSVEAIVQEATSNGKLLRIEVDGVSFDVELKDSLDMMLDTMGYKMETSRHTKQIKAPMPGLVVEVNVEEGQVVKEGTKLLILSAMKMENSIMIQTADTIKKIHVKAGQAVEKGQLLIELE